MDLNQMLIFAKVSELQSFTKAGKELGIEKSNVSAKISKLENRLGVRLLNRTTRSVTMTEAGEGYYRFCEDILKRVKEADAYAESLNSEPRGTLKITAAVDVGQMIVKSLLKTFLEQYSQIKVDLLLTNRKVDLIREQFDVAIRVGDLLQFDSSYIARQIIRTNSGLYASPEFIAKNGTPGSIDELAQHTMIGFASEEVFEERVSVKIKVGKRTVQFTPQHRLKVNDMTSYLESALLGFGIAILPTKFIQHHINSELLVPILPELEFPEIGIFALYPSRHLKSVKLKVFLEYLNTLAPDDITLGRSRVLT
ncbi:MAG: LysR family transcriptional regulator [Proteobacteria bacterium]|nr:LysR family transcriptional regulator [Pseudomonadota bacterium]